MYKGRCLIISQNLDIEKTSAILKLLGDKTRLTMLKILDFHDCCVCEFVALFNTSQPGISQHLKKLKEAGLVKETRRGQWIIYSLNRESEFIVIVQSILQYLPDQELRMKELEMKGLRIPCD